MRLTWQVSSRSVGGCLVAPGRCAQGRCFCPPILVYWACYAASQSEALFSFAVEVSLYRTQCTQTSTSMLEEKSTHNKILTNIRESYVSVRMKSPPSDAIEELVWFPKESFMQRIL